MPEAPAQELVRGPRRYRQPFVAADAGSPADTADADWGGAG